MGQDHPGNAQSEDGPDIGGVPPFLDPKSPDCRFQIHDCSRKHHGFSPVKWHRFSTVEPIIIRKRPLAHAVRAAPEPLNSGMHGTFEDSFFLKTYLPIWVCLNIEWSKLLQNPMFIIISCLPLHWSYLGLPWSHFLWTRPGVTQKTGGYTPRRNQAAPLETATRH